MNDSMALPKAYWRGTHRLLAPEDTLVRIEPHLASFGITRCADVTGLDWIGVPVCCSIRPRNRTLQVSNGKGLRLVDAQVSALMEAIELFHAETPGSLVKCASLNSLRREGRAFVAPDRLPDYQPDRFFSADLLVDWVQAEHLLSGKEVWLPASAAYLCSPSLYHWSSNGLASGNHLVEATLHGLYEVIERDATAHLELNDCGRFTRRCCRFIDLKTVTEGPVRELHDKLLRADIKLVLMWLKSCVPIHTFMAVILDRNAASPCSQMNMGYGTHLSAQVAASRAITEAVQSRLTVIHGARDDIDADIYEKPPRDLYLFFNEIEGKASWRRLEEKATDDLSKDLAFLLESLSQAGYVDVFRVNMTRPPSNIPIVKILASGLELTLPCRSRTAQSRDTQQESRRDLTTFFEEQLPWRARRSRRPRRPSREKKARKCGT